MSVNKKKKMSFVIVAPRVYAGGPIALHELCRELERQGCSAKIFYFKECVYKDKKEYWKNWIKYTWKDLKKQIKKKTPPNDSLGNCKRKIIPIVGKNTIVVYPEVIYGNILRSKKTVRWLLSYNKFEGDPNAYGANDLFFSYRLQFNDGLLNPENKVLKVLYYNFDLYKRTNYGKRNGNCYILYKGKKRNDLPYEYDGVVVDGLPEREKVKVFNECEYCYCYDVQSAYSSIAAMCGCITIIVPEEGKTIADYRSADDERTYGVAFGTDPQEIEFAKNTNSKIKEQIEAEVEKNKSNVADFIETCYEYFFEK